MIFHPLPPPPDRYSHMSIIVFPREFKIYFRSIQAKQVDLETSSLARSLCATSCIEAHFAHLKKFIIRSFVSTKKSYVFRATLAERSPHLYEPILYDTTSLKHPSLDMFTKKIEKLAAFYSCRFCCAGFVF